MTEIPDLSMFLDGEENQIPSTSDSSASALYTPRTAPGSTPRKPLTRRPSATWGPRPVWASAFAANVLNPKAALFFVAVLPQFVTESAPALPQILLLGGADILLGCVFWAAFTLTVSRFRFLLQRRRARIALEAASGTALVGLGGALAFTSRTA
jgi:threonine/homoserine/homoserine lactone efflux protein